MNQKIIRLLIREILKEEDRGSVTVTQGSSPNRSSGGSSGGGSILGAIGSYLFGDADESNADEEVLDEDETD